MLNENIKELRKAKGLSQQELAVRLNVVRQTVSKWEQGLSVPDAQMLISLSEVFETPVSALLGETVTQQSPDDIKAISEKLETINLQLARRDDLRRKALHYIFIAILVAIVAVSALLISLHSPYLNWDFADPETAFMGTTFHIFEWAFVRVAPFLFIAAIFGIVLTGKRV